jgi:hypothetical protein
MACAATARTPTTSPSTKAIPAKSSDLPRGRTFPRVRPEDEFSYRQTGNGEDPMSTAKFTKGQSVTARGSRAANIRYRIKTCHRDGTYTTRALFFLDEQTGEDVPGYLGHLHRVSGDCLVALPEKQPA